MPSTLLLQRPDIRVVEARMRSANANIEVARARLLPPLDLSVQVGYSGLALAQIFQPQSLFWNAASSLALTIFDGGRREADKLLAESAYEEMVETYRQTIYQALREVESALVSITTTRQKLAAQQRNARAMLSMFRVASDAYALGAADVSSLHQARRNYQRSADDLVRTKAELLRAHASLALALGTDSDMATPAGR
jgi:outer membrane protein TolC